MINLFKNQQKTKSWNMMGIKSDESRAPTSACFDSEPRVRRWAGDNLDWGSKIKCRSLRTPVKVSTSTGCQADTTRAANTQTTNRECMFQAGKELASTQSESR